ncbi:hypothetical protein MMC18_005869 [Xylographa bjoerkii]|nr:hypothetical protein [Xylographa bjoerkii]
MATTSWTRGSPAKEERDIVHLPTTTAYDRWAPVYDHDANPLQALDDLELTTLLPLFLDLIARKPHKLATKIVDLGCGTGRNTLKLLSLPSTHVVGLDASLKMLEIALQRCTLRLDSLSVGHRAEKVNFEVFDMMATAALPDCARNADTVLSTLVLEHIPLAVFFGTAAKLLVEGGYLLVTNMHAEMGARSQAGFVDPETGAKVRPKSFVYGIEEVLAQAGENGFHVVGEARERAVRDEDLPMLGWRAEKWIGVRCWFGVMFEKL